MRQTEQLVQRAAAGAGKSAGRGGDLQVSEPEGDDQSIQKGPHGTELLPTPGAKEQLQIERLENTADHPSGGGILDLRHGTRE